MIYLAQALLAVTKRRYYTRLFPIFSDIAYATFADVLQRIRYSAYLDLVIFDIQLLTSGSWLSGLLAIPDFSRGNARRGNARPIVATSLSSFSPIRHFANCSKHQVDVMVGCLLSHLLAAQHALPSFKV